MLTPLKNITFRLSKLGAQIYGTICNNGIDAYWWNFLPNSGDLVTPFLLRHYGFTPIHTWKNDAKVLACGSILQNLPENYTGYIIGSGLLTPESAIQLKKAKILAVRGSYTRDCIGAPTNILLGDPGLLVTEVYREKARKLFSVGVVPHYKGKNSVKIQKLCEKYPQDVHFIDIQRSVRQVLRDIDQCEYILSSSLHGLVFADALEIPCAWIVLTNSASEAYCFKYMDYNSALNREQRPVFLETNEKLSALVKQTSKPSKDSLEQVKINLNSAFLQFKEEFRRK